MHDESARPEGGIGVVATAIAFVAGIALGINIAGGPMAVASDVHAPMFAQARVPAVLPALPPEAAAAFALARELDADAVDESRECMPSADDRCIFN